MFISALLQDLSVVFDLYFDRKTCKKIAKNVTLIEEEPDIDEAGPQRGVIYSVKSKEGSRYGMIRIFPSNGLVFWHSSCLSTSSEISMAQLKEGSLVEFHIRIRSGIRCAVNIALHAPPSNNSPLNTDQEAEGYVVSVVTGLCHGVIVDWGTCDAVWDIYVDPMTAIARIHEGAIAKEEGKQGIQADIWSKSDVSLLSAGTGTGSSGFAEHAAETKLVEQAVNEEGSKEKKVWCTPIPRAPIPFEAPSEGCSPPPVGAMLRCSVVMNWAASPAPILLKPLALDDERCSRPLTAAGRYQGIVNRVRLRVTDAAAVSMMEIRREFDSDLAPKEEGLTSSADGLSSSTMKMCYAEEGVTDGSRRRGTLFSVGDPVEFLLIPNTDLAVGVVNLRAPISYVRPKKEKDSGNGEMTSLQRTPINLELKSGGGVGKAATVILMAEGPPDDAATGFAKDWRAKPSAEFYNGLSWSKQLLSHLYSEE